MKMVAIFVFSWRLVDYRWCFFPSSRFLITCSFGFVSSIRSRRWFVWMRRRFAVSATFLRDIFFFFKLKFTSVRCVQNIYINLSLHTFEYIKWCDGSADSCSHSQLIQLRLNCFVFEWAWLMVWMIGERWANDAVTEVISYNRRWFHGGPEGSWGTSLSSPNSDIEGLSSQSVHYHCVSFTGLPAHFLLPRIQERRKKQNYEMKFSHIKSGDAAPKKAMKGNTWKLMWRLRNFIVRTQWGNRNGLLFGVPLLFHIRANKWPRWRLVVFARSRYQNMTKKTGNGKWHKWQLYAYAENGECQICWNTLILSLNGESTRTLSSRYYFSLSAFAYEIQWFYCVWYAAYFFFASWYCWFWSFMSMWHMALFAVIRVLRPTNRILFLCMGTE